MLLLIQEFSPNEMKIAKVRPLFKKGARQDVQNYRPISILPFFFQNLIKVDVR
jgi:hypothetical protein